MEKRTVNSEMTAIKDIILQTVACEKIYLFGSYAYGTPNEDSDYDFYVVLKDDAKNPHLVEEDISLNLRRIKRTTPVDILAGYKTRFEERAQFLTLEKKIAREGVMLYDRDDHN